MARFNAELIDQVLRRTDDGWVGKTHLGGLTVSPTGEGIVYSRELGDLPLSQWALDAIGAPMDWYSFLSCEPAAVPVPILVATPAPVQRQRWIGDFANELGSVWGLPRLRPPGQ
jgi:hypothetical protein